MTDISTLRKLAGPAYNDLPDAEIVGTFDEITRILGRALMPSESSFYRAALADRRGHLQKQAGKTQPEFVAEMYDTPRRSAADSNEQGEG